MTDLQKFAWTIAFGGLYLIAGIRACNWLTSQLGDLNVVAPISGIVTSMVSSRDAGRFLRKGEAVFRL